MESVNINKVRKNDYKVKYCFKIFNPNQHTKVSD